MARKEAPLDVRIPSLSEDRPVLSRVGVVAVLGFVLGIAWPKLLGVKLGPDAPGGGKDAETEAAVAAAPTGSAAAAPPSAGDGAEDDAAEASTVTNKQRAILASLTVARCRDAKGKKLEEGTCAPLAAERWIEPRLRDLAGCPEAIGLEGDMELELDIDFDKKSVRVDQGRKSEFPTSTVRGVLKCAGDELGQLELEKIPHTQPRVTLLAKMRFVPPGKALEPEPAATGEKGEPAGDGKGEASLGTASVSWEKALLRDAPKDGKVVARVPQGSRVKILEQRDEWYLVQPAKGDAKGWVYRQAIGK